jgi:hypothetical protein
MKGKTMTSEELFDLLAIDEPDRRGCVALLEGSDDDPLIDSVIQALLRSFGSSKEVFLDEPTQEPLIWLTAFLRLTPRVVEWHRAKGIPERVIRNTLADVGRHLAISRRVTGEFSLQTWRWLTHHYTVRIFALGRLQFALQRCGVSVEGVIEPTNWVLALHIPESGPLLPTLIDESLAEAAAFFPRHFPDQPVTAVVCHSWMLDPFLLGRVAPTSNVGSFIRRFTPMGCSTDGHTDALYFVFRTRDLAQLENLPRTTSLQRAVLDRLEMNQSWQVAGGYFLLQAHPASRR